MKPSIGILSAALIASAGCVTPIRASNRSFAPDDRASIRFPGGEAAALEWLTHTFKAGGFTTQTGYGVGPLRVHVFKAARGDVEGSVFWGARGRAPEIGSTVPVGSVFYVFLKPFGDGTTEMTFYGKPTLAGHEVCGDQDRAWKLPCVEVEAARTWEARRELSGAVEAQAIRKLLDALAERYSEKAASFSIATFEPPGELRGPSAAPSCTGPSLSGVHSARQPACDPEDKTIVDDDIERRLTTPTFVSGKRL